MLPMKRVPVMAVLVNSEGEACGFSKPLTPDELSGKERIVVYIDRDIEVRGMWMDFAVPGGVIAVARSFNLPTHTCRLFADQELHLKMEHPYA